MDRMLYVGMNGAKQTMESLTATNNNLANSSTTAFKADLLAFQSVPVAGDGYASRVNNQLEQKGVDLKNGPLITTGNSMDVAVNGDGWIAVQGQDGNEAYTRAGNLGISSFGILQTASGNPVMGNGGPITIPPYEKLEIGGDGTISIAPLGQPATAMAVIDRIKLVSADAGAVTKSEDGLIRSKDGSALPADANVKVDQGVLESSNVNVVESMVRMITLSRQFETQVKVMKTAEDIDSSSSKLLQISG